MEWSKRMQKRMRTNTMISIACKTISIILAMAFLLCPQNSAGQIVNSGEVSNGREQYIDKEIQSNIYAFTIDPLNPSVLYAMTRNGVFKSIDGGEHWNYCGLKNLSLHSLAIDPKRPGRIYAGAAWGTIFRSIDGGKNWITIRSIDGPIQPHVRILAINPQNPETIYAGTNDGMLRSTDSGESWHAINNGIQANPNFQALAIDPKHPEIIYAGTEYDHGLFKSINGGDSWFAVNKGLSDLSIEKLAIDPEKTNKIFAVTESRELFISKNGGLAWSKIDHEKWPDISPDGAMAYRNVETIVINPKNPAKIYTGANGGMFKSKNGGKSWRAIASHQLMSDAVEYLVVDPQNPEILYAATWYGCLFKSTDGGGNWRMLAGK
jgi:photosystem II stability/assembly factor-like uncharacterized protein